MKLRDLILTAIFAALTAVSAFIRIPLPPPLPMITLQVFIVILAGLLLPPPYAMMSQLVYVLLGLFGLPIFTEGGGFNYVLKPTFGFLLGFIFAAWLIAVSVQHIRFKKKFWVYLIASIAGILAIYLIGVPYGYMILNVVMGAGLTVKQVITAFCAIYLPIDLVKAILATGLSSAILNRVKR